jgi:hypothetical protein
MVLTPENRGERYPSTVVVDEGRLYFGWQAEERRQHAAHVWDSLKAHAAVGNGWATPSGLESSTLAEIVALALTHLVAVGLRHARLHATPLKATARMGMTLGAPERHLEIRSEAYLDAAVTAFQLANAEAFDPQGQPVAICLSRAAAAREAAVARVVRTPETRNRWLRAEVAAAMMWLYESPRVAEGPYTVVDIGAATTNASYFRIHDGQDADGARRRKGGIAFFGAETGPTGMDALGAALATAEGPGTTSVGLRGREAPLLDKHRTRPEVTAVVDRMYDSWARARQNAWPRAPELKHWAGLRSLIIGGGSRCPGLVRRFDELPGYLRGKIDGFRPLGDPGRPRDLNQFAASPRTTPHRGDHTFLLVAYGLSFRTGDLPDITLPSETAPFDAQQFHRPFKTSEDLGYD